MRLNGERGEGGQFLCPGHCIGERPDTMNSALLHQLRGRIHADAEQHIARDRPPEFVARTFDRPLVDREPQLRGRNTESTRRSRHAQVACQGQLGSRTHRGAVDGRERDARQRRESTQCRAKRRTEFITFDAREVGARAECRRLARENHDTRPLRNRVLVFGNQEQGLEVDGVASVWSPNRDDCDVFVVPVKCDGGFAPLSRFVPRYLYHLHDNMTSGSPSPSSPSNNAGQSAAAFDPVRARRQQVAKWSLLANRIGYLLYAATVTCFVLAFAIGFNGAMVGIMTAGLIGGSILLAPSIVLGYAVKAAEREDRENNR